MSATTKAAAAAAAPSYVVARGVVVTMNPKTKKTTEIGEGKPFTPADEAEAADLLANGTIMTAEDYATKVGGSSVTSAINTANARADTAEARAAAAEAELKALKEAAAAGGGGAPAPTPTPTA